MKECIVDIPFFVNNENMQYLLNGRSITNISDYPKLASNYVKEFNGNIYKTRDKEEGISFVPEHDSAIYSDNGDIIVGKIVGINDSSLTINIIESLYYSKLNDPRIRVNGLYIEDGDETHIKIIKFTRLTLSSYSNKNNLNLNF